jgi:hypothetical protein
LKEVLTNKVNMHKTYIIHYVMKISARKSFMWKQWLEA